MCIHIYVCIHIYIYIVEYIIDTVTFGTPATPDLFLGLTETPMVPWLTPNLATNIIPTKIA